jgi:hypothetical protein
MAKATKPAKGVKRTAVEDVGEGEKALTEAELRQQIIDVRCELDEVKSSLKKMKRRRKTTGPPQQINPYMFWSNVYQGGERKKVVAENGGPFNQTTNPNGISVSSAAKILGEKWRTLPQAARDTFKVLRDDHIRDKAVQVEKDAAICVSQLENEAGEVESA